MANPVNTVGIVMPEDFDHISYDSVNLRLSHHTPLNPPAWSQFAAAWNGVAYRYRACYEYDTDFTQLVSEKGVNLSFETRFLEEKLLFGFFINGLATFESICFALYSIGAMRQPNQFAISESKLRNVKPSQVAKDYRNEFSTEAISQVLEHLFEKIDPRGPYKNPEFNEWNDVRNLLIHRSTTSRHISLDVNSGRQLTPPKWKFLPDFEISTKTTSRRRLWHSEQVNKLLKEIDSFTKNQFGD